MTVQSFAIEGGRVGGKVLPTRFESVLAPSGSVRLS